MHMALMSNGSRLLTALFLTFSASWQAAAQIASPAPSRGPDPARLEAARRMLDIPFPKPLLVSEARRLLQEFKNSLPRSQQNELDGREARFVEIVAANLVVALIDTAIDFSVPIYARELTIEEMTATGDFLHANEAVRQAMALGLSTGIEGMIRCLNFAAPKDAAAGPAETLDAEKLALARRLVEVLEVDIQASEEAIRTCVTETTAQGFARRMTVDAMKALIAFYASPNGQRFAAVSQQAATELSSVVAATLGNFIAIR